LNPRHRHKHRRYAHRARRARSQSRRQTRCYRRPPKPSASQSQPRIDVDFARKLPPAIVTLSIHAIRGRVKNAARQQNRIHGRVPGPSPSPVPIPARMPDTSIDRYPTFENPSEAHTRYRTRLCGPQLHSPTRNRRGQALRRSATLRRRIRCLHPPR
jgi:hypothetical protein